MKIIAHGIDLVDFKRIQKLIDSHGDRFLERVYTEKERLIAASVKNKIEKFAGRFAAKEAILKLIGTGLRGKICWKDIEVINDPMGAPVVNLFGEVKSITEKKNIEQITLSITHTADFAIASAVAIKQIDQ